MNKNNIIVIADSRPNVGMGHKARCIALTQILLDAGYKAELFEDLDPSSVGNTLERNLLTKNLVILDGYDYDISYETKIKSHNIKLIRVIDFPLQDSKSDGLISQSLYGKDFPSDQPPKLLGLECALLRGSFTKPLNHKYNNQIDFIKPPKNIFICFGALDVHNYSSKILQIVKQTLKPLEVNVVTSVMNSKFILKNYSQIFEYENIRLNVYSGLSEQEIFDLIYKADLVIASASNIAIEACAVGAALIVGVSADNQQCLYKQLIERCLALGIGDVNSVDAEQVKQAVCELLSTRGCLNNLLQAQSNVFDGNANKKIIEFITRVLNA